MHNISPLPAYNEDHSLIAPNDYQRKLCGAIVQVHFALIHYFIKQSKKSVFTAVTREILVLRAPVPAPLNPLKRARLTDGPAIGSSTDWKKLCGVSTFSSIHINCPNHSFFSFEHSPFHRLSPDSMFFSCLKDTSHLYFFPT